MDASAALSAILNDGSARRAVSDEALHVPHLIDAEVASALRGLVLGGQVGEDSARLALEAWCRLGLTRYAMSPFVGRVWQLRENLSGYDAFYIALAEELGCSLVTADGRLSRAPGISCPVTVVPG